MVVRTHTHSPQSLLQPCDACTLSAFAEISLDHQTDGGGGDEVTLSLCKSIHHTNDKSTDVSDHMTAGLKAVSMATAHHPLIRCGLSHRKYQHECCTWAKRSASSIYYPTTILSSTRHSDQWGVKGSGFNFLSSFTHKQNFQPKGDFKLDLVESTSVFNKNVFPLCV